MNDIEIRYQVKRSGFSLNVDLKLPMHGVTALFGASGSGKTTLLRCIAGMEKAEQGYLRLGEDIWQSKDSFVPVYKRNLGYVFQEANLFEHLSVAENLRYGLKRLAKKQRKVSFEDAVHWLGLASLLDHYPSELSGGQRQRAAIARALLSSPKLLLMDEPLASLDLQSKTDILPYIERLHENLNIPIIYVSHAPNEVLRIADHMVLLDRGNVIAQGSVNELMTRPDLPLAHLEESAAVIEGAILSHDFDYHLSNVGIKGGQVAVSLKELDVGKQVRIKISARDVSVSREPNINTSISNVLPAKILSLNKTYDPAKTIVKLDVSGDTILAQITTKSAADMDLHPNHHVYAQVKSVALMG